MRLRPRRHGDRLVLSLSTLIRHFLAGGFPAVPGLTVGVVVPARPALLVPPVRAPLALTSRPGLALPAAVHVAPIARTADHERPLVPLAPTPKPNAASPLQTSSPSGSTSGPVRENLETLLSRFPQALEPLLRQQSGLSLCPPNPISHLTTRHRARRRSAAAGMMLTTLQPAVVQISAISGDRGQRTRHSQCLVES